MYLCMSTFLRLYVLETKGDSGSFPVGPLWESAHAQGESNAHEIDDDTWSNE